MTKQSVVTHGWRKNCWRWATAALWRWITRGASHAPRWFAGGASGASGTNPLSSGCDAVEQGTDVITVFTLDKAREVRGGGEGRANPVWAAQSL
ncbi:hypothetical protein ACNKHT_21975 [Shigella flexneri]